MVTHAQKLKTVQTRLMSCNGKGCAQGSKLYREGIAAWALHRNLAVQPWPEVSLCKKTAELVPFWRSQPKRGQL